MNAESFNAAIHPGAVEGSIRIPASKSACHRALICAGLAKGVSALYGLSLSRDIEATIRCLRAMEAKIELSENAEDHTVDAAVQGTGPERFSNPLLLDAGESGSTLRFFIPIAASGKNETLFSGRPSLMVRPMGIYKELFEQSSLPFLQSGQKICFHGILDQHDCQVPGNISSQFISGLLLAAPLHTASTTIHVIGSYESRSYTQMTIDMMQRFGVEIHETEPSVYSVPARSVYQPARIHLEADDSQAAFFAVLAALNAPLKLEGVSSESRQGDSVIFDLLEQCGARVVRNKDHAIVFPAEKGSRKPLHIDLANCPDLGPVLCVLAAFLPGETRIEHAARLRYKECDRIAAMEEELRKWGVHIQSDEDSITIHGKESWSSPDGKPVILDGHNDHRIVMAMTIFGLCAESESCITGAQAVNKSYPNFFLDVQKIGGKVVLK